MALAARFRVDPKLAALLGEGYRTAEHALKELIDNAWDADAGSVRVTLPEAFTGAAIVVEDDGTGMTEAELRRDYLAIARSRASRKGEVTVERRRIVKGRKGIGKFAGLVLADTMIIETRCRGIQSRLVIRAEDLAHSSSMAGPYREDTESAVSDLEAIELPLESSPCEPELHGTTITLQGLSQVFDPPTPERLRPVLMLEYGRQPDFAVVVNGDALGVEDIPGSLFSHEDSLQSAGHVRLRFTVSESKKALRQSGIALRVMGKVIAKPTMFGLEEDEEIPPKLLKKVYGELEADALVSSVTGDWGDVVETRAYAEVAGWASVHLKRALSQVFANEVQLARARLVQHVARRLAELPEHRRQFAEEKIERVLIGMYGEKEERVATVVSVALDAIEQDDYFAVVQAVESAKTSDVATFASALADFGLVDMAHMAEQARRRMQFLSDLDDLIANPATREQEVHTALEHNLWVLGPEFALMSSNRTLRRMIEERIGRQYQGERANERPDLLLLDGVSGRRVLIEFKRPSIAITRAHEAQATSYRDELLPVFPTGIDVLLIGKEWSLASDRTFVPTGLQVTSYTAVVAKARTELEWMLRQLQEEGDAYASDGASEGATAAARLKL